MNRPPWMRALHFSTEGLSARMSEPGLYEVRTWDGTEQLWRGYAEDALDALRQYRTVETEVRAVHCHRLEPDG